MSATTSPTPAPAESTRERELREMIAKAQANPGVVAAMEVFGRAQAVVAQVQPYMQTRTPCIQSLNDRASP